MLFSEDLDVNVMDQLIVTILACSSDRDVQLLHDQLSSREDELRLILRSGSSELPKIGLEALDSVVAHLNLEQQSLGCAHIVRAQAWLLYDWRVTHRRDHHGKPPCKSEVDVAYAQLLLMFLRRLERWVPCWGTRQLRFGPTIVVQLCKTVTELVCEEAATSMSFATAGVAAEVIVMAAMRMEPDMRVLTPMHADALQCFLVAKRYSAAAAFARDRCVSSVAGVAPLRVFREVWLGQQTKGHASQMTFVPVTTAVTFAVSEESHLHGEVISPLMVAPSQRPMPPLQQPSNHRSLSLLAEHKAAYREQHAYMSQSGLECSHLLRSLYYAGVAYIALGYWTEAVDAFKACLCTPAVTASAITIAAVKKMVLCAVLSNDEPSALELPKYCPAVVSRFLRGHKNFQRYRDLTKAVLRATVVDTPLQDGINFSATGASYNTPAALAALLDGSDMFRCDGNYALAERAVNHVFECKALQLQRVYASLTLDDIACCLGVANVGRVRALLEHFALKHIGDRDVNFTINAATKSLSFAVKGLECGVGPCENNNRAAGIHERLSTRRLEDEMSNIRSLAQGCILISHHLQTSPTYLHKSANHDVQGTLSDTGTSHHIPGSESAGFVEGHVHMNFA